MYVSLLKCDYFWSSVSLALIRYSASCSTCAPTDIWFHCIIIAVRIGEKVLVLCMEDCH